MSDRSETCRRLAFAGATLISVLHSGCGIVPEEYIPPKRFDRNIGKESLAQCIPGITSRKDILIAFGEPDSFKGYGHQFTYEQISTSGRLSWVEYLGDHQRGKVTSKGMRMVIDFDEQGIVTRCVLQPFNEQAP